jgi:hypothetical protein
MRHHCFAAVDCRPGVLLVLRGNPPGVPGRLGGTGVPGRLASSTPDGVGSEKGSLPESLLPSLILARLGGLVLLIAPPMLGGPTATMRDAKLDLSEFTLFLALVLPEPVSRSSPAVPCCWAGGGDVTFLTEDLGVGRFPLLPASPGEAAMPGDLGIRLGGAAVIASALLRNPPPAPPGEPLAAGTVAAAVAEEALLGRAGNEALSV